MNNTNTPNTTTHKAIATLEAGKGERFGSVEALMTDLESEDTYTEFLEECLPVGLIGDEE